MSPPGPRLKILLSEGSSLSARHTVSALGPAGHVLDVLDPQPFCLARFSRHVRAWHRCPPFARDPAGYRDFLERRLRAGRYDALLPTHDQVYLLARFRERLGRQVGLAVPPFAALERVQSKAGFARLLMELGLGCPATEFLRGRAALERWADYPCYVKLAHGTAGRGVWHVRDRAEMRSLVEQLGRSGRGEDGEILVQRPARGDFCVVQAVFQHGRLLAAHSYQARAVGVGGSAWARVAVDHPGVRHDLARLGARLGWHGGLHLEYFHDPARQTAVYVDGNPRIGETMNATLSGLNLCALLLRVSLGERLTPLPPAGPGMRTHSLLMRLLALGERRALRRRLLAECWRAATGDGLYRGSREELTPPRQDPWSLLPAIAVALRLLVRPATAEAVIRGAVDRYALTAEAARAIRELAAEVGTIPCPADTLRGRDRARPNPERAVAHDPIA